MLRFVLVLSLAAQIVDIGFAAPPPPLPPEEFSLDQTPAKPAPFPVKLVDLGATNPKLKGITAPAGFKVDIVAEEPVVVNPVGMAFAPDGSLFVLEWRPDVGRDWSPFVEIVRYKDGTTRELTTMKKQVFDVIKRLQYDAKSGTYVKADVVITEELPSTILFHDGWLYTASRGTVRRYKQSPKGGGKWDTRETIAQGFCGFHHHQVSGLTIGLDGLLYITTGDDDNIAEGSDGSRATVMRTGAVFRCKPDGSKLEVYSIGYRNPYRDIVMDDRGHFFHVDNDQEDGSKFQGSRLLHVAEESDYGWRLKEGVRCCRTDFVRGAVAGERPGKLPPMLKTGRGSPAGLLIYNDTALPAKYRGLLYYPDVFRKLIRAYKVAPKGSSFEVTGELDFMTATDPLFRPCQMATGPDGAIYVCDWRTDSGGAGKLFGDGLHGRIYRLSWDGKGAGKDGENEPEILSTTRYWNAPQLTTPALAAELHSPNATARRGALKELIRRTDRDPKVIRALLHKEFESDAPVPTRMLALGGLCQLWDDDVHTLFVKLALANDEDADIRRFAIEALGQHAKSKDANVADKLTRALNDPDFGVRRAAALGLGRIAAPGTSEVLINAWTTDNSGDPFLVDAYLRGLERLGKPGIDALLVVANSGKKAEIERVAAVFMALRTRPAADALIEMLLNPHITTPQRIELVRSYANYQLDPPISIEPLAKFLAERPDEPDDLKAAGLETLAFCNGLSSPPAASFVLSLLDSKADDVRLTAIRAVETGRVTAAGSKLLEVLSDGKRTVSERMAALAAARAIGDKNLTTATLALLNAEGESAAFQAEALRTAIVLDPPAARKVAEKLLDSPDTHLLEEAIAVLATHKDGAKLVGERYLARKLPRGLFPRVSDALRKFAGDPVIDELNTSVMKGGLLLSLEPGQAEKIRQEVLTRGNAKKGKAVYLDVALVACASCHRMEGVGGSVGPDLTRIWDTISFDKLLESIIEPNKEIKEGYQSYRAVTLDGQVFSGLKVSETPKELVLREANGRDRFMKKADLDEYSATKISLMPDNAAAQLSYDQFVDLLAFMKSRKEQESLRGMVIDYSVLVGVKGDLKTRLPLEDRPDPTAKVPDIQEGWQTRSADGSGLLAIKPLVPTEPTGVYLLTYILSGKRQTAQATLIADDPVRVIVAGKNVFERHEPKAGALTAEEKFEIVLEAGWTPVLLKVTTSGPVHKLGLQFSGESLRVAPRPIDK